MVNKYLRRVSIVCSTFCLFWEFSQKSRWFWGAYLETVIRRLAKRNLATLDRTLSPLTSLLPSKLSQLTFRRFFNCCLWPSSKNLSDVLKPIVLATLFFSTNNKSYPPSRDPFNKAAALTCIFQESRAAYCIATVCILLITEALPTQATVMLPVFVFRELEFFRQPVSLMPVSVAVKYSGAGYGVQCLSCIHQDV